MRDEANQSLRIWSYRRPGSPDTGTLCRAFSRLWSGLRHWLRSWRFRGIAYSCGYKGDRLDHSQEAVTICEAKGLTVYEEDANQYLQRNPGQFGGFFCSHVIEHMDYATAIAFLELCHAALRPEGKTSVDNAELGGPLLSLRRPFGWIPLTSGRTQENYSGPYWMRQASRSLLMNNIWEVGKRWAGATFPLTSFGDCCWDGILVNPIQ